MTLTCDEKTVSKNASNLCHDKWQQAQSRHVHGERTGTPQIYEGQFFSGIGDCPLSHKIELSVTSRSLPLGVVSTIHYNMFLFSDDGSNDPY